MIGNYITARTTENTDQFRNLGCQRMPLGDEKVRIAYDLLKTGGWQLTGLDLFHITHGDGLLSGVCGTILTYLIFLFQLRSTEKSQEATEGSAV